MNSKVDENQSFKVDGNQQPGEFYTKDLNEAGTILASGIKLLRLERELNFYWFVFEDKNTQEICNKFWSGELMINAKQFSDALRSLKDQLFARTNAQRRLY